MHTSRHWENIRDGSIRSIRLDLLIDRLRRDRAEYTYLGVRSLKAKNEEALAFIHLARPVLAVFSAQDFLRGGNNGRNDKGTFVFLLD